MEATGSGENRQAEDGLRFLIDDVFGIEHAEIRLQPGRVNRLVGKNGAGKTSAILAILRLLGDESVSLEVRDGAELGTIQGAGAKVVVPDKGRVRIDGDPEVTPADLAAVTSLITGDHRKGDKERNAARIEAFLRLVRPVIDERAIKLLCERDEEMVAWLADQVASGAARDLLAAANRLREELQRRAREKEDAAEHWAGQHEAAKAEIAAAEGNLKALGAERVEDPNPGARGRELEEAVRAHERTVDAAGARRRQEEHVQRIRDAAAPRPDVEAAALAESTAVDEHEAAIAEVRRIQERREELLRQLGVVEVDLAAARSNNDAANRRLSEARRHSGDVQRALEQWEEQQRTIAEPIEGPVQTDVDAAAAAVEAARREVNVHTFSAAFDAAREAAHAAATREGQERDRGKQLRGWNKAVPLRLADVLKRQGIEGFTVVDGRLAWQGPGDEQPRDFDTRLSEGERIAATLALAGGRFRGLVYLGPEFYASLDHQHRAELEALAASRLDVIIVTEEPTEGALDVAHGVTGVGDAAPVG